MFSICTIKKYVGQPCYANISACYRKARRTQDEYITQNIYTMDGHNLVRWYKNKCPVVGQVMFELVLNIM